MTTLIFLAGTSADQEFTYLAAFLTLILKYRHRLSFSSESSILNSTTIIYLTKLYNKLQTAKVTLVPRPFFH